MRERVLPSDRYIHRSLLHEDVWSSSLHFHSDPDPLHRRAYLYIPTNRVLSFAMFAEANADSDCQATKGKFAGEIATLSPSKIETSAFLLYTIWYVIKRFGPVCNNTIWYDM